MENSLSPAYVRINYESQYGPHSMTIPSVPVIAAVGGGSPYIFDLRGLEIDVNVETAVGDFIDLIRPFFKPHVNFVDYTLFTQADPDATAVPVESNTIGLLGTSASAAWDKAAQQTWTWRTDAFGIFKLVLLDSVSDNSWDKISGLGVGSPQAILSAYITAPETWVAGRDGGRPNVFLQIAKTLNEKLRRSYRMN